MSFDCQTFWKDWREESELFHEDLAGNVMSCALESSALGAPSSAPMTLQGATQASTFTT